MEPVMLYLKTNFISVGTAAFIIALTITVLYIALAEKRKEELLKREGIVVPAIVDCYRTDDGICEMFYYFTTLDGKSIFGKAAISAGPFMEAHYPPGSEISIMYAPSKPKQTCRFSDKFMKDLDYQRKKDGADFPFGF